jgi:uncharacterized protein (UPF0548 family)
LSIVKFVTHGPFWLRRPNEQQLKSVLSAQSKFPVTCATFDMSDQAHAPRGFKETGGSVLLGHGQSVLDGAVQNIKHWRVHEHAGLNVTPHGTEVNESDDVMLLKKLLIGYVTVSCRVLSITQSRDQWGFTYGTLPHHVERGEELFMVARASDGAVTFTVRAMSRPGHFLTKVGAPVARLIQRTATNNYLRAMADLVNHEIQ